MKSLEMFLLVLLFAVPCFGQDFDFNRYGNSPLDKWTERFSSQRQPLADLRANQYDRNSLSNPYGAGSRYKADGLNNPFSRYGSQYSNQSATNPYATEPPKIYGSDGAYHGELSASPYRRDSASNPYSRYGSPYSRDSINNPYGAGSPYRSQPLYVYPPR